MTLTLGSAYPSSRTTVAERHTHGHYQCGGNTHPDLFGTISAPTKKAVNGDWLADDAVHNEPVSTLDSLITGKNTGKLTKAGLLRPRQRSNQPDVAGAFDAIP
jgi:hypothetical protein